ncbi:hypothetical protein B9T25_01450 [Acinetobacter sp. ANC 4470]|nr:DUF559 domain-containing protein [Acinetobacter sp. ANC 4470]OTG69286.1 hypothetical protein B9T25_01450 [Acinetobacter sp. ANC 4470]
MRDEVLAQLGLRVLRCNNGQVLREIDAVIHVISGVVASRLAKESP